MFLKVSVTPMNVILILKWSLKGKVLIPKANIKEVGFVLVAVITPQESIVNTAKKAIFDH